MNVGSYLELYTTLFGWMLYDKFWDILCTTAIAVLPFIGKVIYNWRKPMESEDNRPPVNVSIRRMEFAFYGALVIVMIAVVPLWPLRASVLKYSPPPTARNPNPPTVSAGATGTTYDSTSLAATGTVRVPLLWEAVMQIAAGINHYSIKSLPSVSDLHGMEMQLAAAHIKDPALAREVSAFATSCFMPARAKYGAMYASGEVPASIQTILNKYGADDTEWMGSHVFLATEGLYKRCPQPDRCGTGFQAQQPIVGWSYVKERDFNSTTDEKNPPQWGRPRCDEWWENPDKGLKSKLIGTSKYIDKLGMVIDSAVRDKDLGVGAATLDQTRWDDAIVRRILTNSSGDMIPTDYAYANTAGSDGINSTAGLSGLRWARYAVKQIVGLIGTAKEEIAFSSEMTIILQAMVMVQAILLMSLYMFLPWMLVIGNYEWPVVKVGILAIFSVKFWSTLWAIAWYLDQNLVHVMYPSPAGMYAFFSGSGGGTKRMLLDLVTSSLYIALPVIWTIIIGWAGVRELSTTQGAGGMIGRGSAGAESQARGTGSQVASAAASAAKGGMS